MHGNRPEREQLENAEIIIGNIPSGDLQYCRNLKFLQLSMAGSDTFAGKVPENVLLANSSGAYGLAISEHMLGMLLMLTKKLYLYRDNQNEAVWHDEGNVTSIFGSRVLTVGLGDIGGEFAKRCKSLGAYNIGIRRTMRSCPEFMDEMHTLDELDSLLPSADVVALALPNSEASRHLMNEARLRSMKRGAILLNVGRGSAVDTDALVKVLNEGLIMAGIDVTDPEPLPKEHPLWHCPGIIITPHISGYYHLRHTQDTIIEIAACNIENYMNGRPIRNLVDRITGYRAVENRY
ncbi:MAG: D-2-hydroxyacid dehydrogenase [Clostridiales bacterium]|nr:D-2-hydroxyacid dehydrogenase [Clostridiales bacterium]MDD7688184.1 D-2-hydroxyacid dehydrogenase [Clostridiales bacterium]